MNGKGKNWGNAKEMSGTDDLPEILSYDEIDALFAACVDLEELAFLAVGYFGGLRLSEILGLRPIDVRPDTYAVFVRSESAKFGKERLTPVTPLTIGMLRGLSEGKGAEDRIFTRGNRAYQLRLDNLAKKAGLTRKIHPHMLRHTCASMQLDQGVDIQTVCDNLGHSDISITQIYLHLDIRRRRRRFQDALRGVV